MKVTFTHNREKAQKALREAANATLDDFCEDINDNARPRTPIDTHLMKSSWDYVESGDLARTVGNKTHYAYYNEFGFHPWGGTKYIPPRPMLQPAYDEVGPKLPDIAKKHFGNM